MYAYVGTINDFAFYIMRVRLKHLFMKICFVLGNKADLQKVNDIILINKKAKDVHWASLALVC